MNDSTHPTSNPRETWLLAIAIGALYATAIVFSLHGAERTDELYHYAQIQLFRHGEFRVLDYYLTTIPGYHAVVAALLWIGGLDSLGAARAITALFGLAAAAAFHSLRTRTQPGTESLATAQFFVLPVLAPFFFLVYTDVLALALVLWATVATTRGKHVLSALIISAALLVRQSDVVWAGFLAALAVWPHVRERGLVEFRALARLFVPYLLPVIAFLAFWAWNGSISLSRVQAGAHPAMTFHLANVILALVVAGFLFPLQALLGLRDFAIASRVRKWLFAIPPLVFAAVYFGFHADNPYNTAFPDFYLHNGLVQAISNHAGWRALAAAVATFAACGLALTRLSPAAAFWLYPISAFALAAEWLVETRYLIVPFALWLAFREQRSKAVEYASLALWATLAVWIIAGMLSGRIFP